MPQRQRAHPPALIVEQFDPTTAHPQWPDAVRPWGAGQAQPRDMSWGYVDTPTGRVHVQVGDWIVTSITGETFVYSDEAFRGAHPLDHG